MEINVEHLSFDDTSTRYKKNCDLKCSEVF